jgi:serine protease AprX
MRRARTAVTAVPLLCAAALSAVPAMAAAPAATTSSDRLVRAVISVHRGASLPVRPAGGRVLAVYRHVNSELVVAPRASLARLASNSVVAGIAPDWRGAVASRNTDPARDSAGVLAPQVVGGTAGEPETGAGVTVALLDTGVSDTPALNRASGRLIDGVDVTSLGDGNDGTPTGPLTDGYGHGTFMASLIAGGPVPGSGDLALGIAPAADVVVVKVAGRSGRTRLSEVLAGLDWVATHAAAIQVVNLSVSVASPTAPQYGSDPLTAAVEAVQAAGVLVVAAAGNTANQVGDPGIDPQVLTVGSADIGHHDAEVSDFSGSGTVAGVVKPDLVAPGEHVLGEIAPDSVVAKQNQGQQDSYGLMRGSGTSEATAVASGAAAAYLSAHHRADPLAVKAALRGMAEPLCSWGSGAGLLALTSSDAQCNSRHDRSGVNVATDPTGEAGFDASSWQANSWLHGAWVSWLASSWSASSWSASSWSASSWSASSWSASSWSASSWSASSWSDADWGS